MESDRNYFGEVGKHIREVGISYHNSIDIVEKYLKDNKFNNNEKQLVTKHIVDQFSLELTYATLTSDQVEGINFDPNYDYHNVTLELLNSVDTDINNINKKVVNLFNKNKFSHNHKLFFNHILLHHFEMKVFEARLKSCI